MPSAKAAILGQLWGYYWACVEMQHAMARRQVVRAASSRSGHRVAELVAAASVLSATFLHATRLLFVRSLFAKDLGLGSMALRLTSEP